MAPVYLLGILAFLFGAAGFGLAGGLLFGLLGAGLGRVWRLPARMTALENRLQAEIAGLRERIEHLERKLLKLSLTATPTAQTTEQAQEITQPDAVAPDPSDTQRPTVTPEPSPSLKTVPLAESVTEIEAETAARKIHQQTSTDTWHSADTSDPEWVSRISNAVRNFFLGGNPVVRIGMVVLFFGVAFLVKYAAERNVFPIELRLSGIAIGALALLAFGWKLRDRAGHYGLVLQGGGVGVLFLTVYGAAKIYGLIPVGLSFFIMLALVALSGLLSVLQNARSLAIFGSAGGFLAPVLASTGGGSHVMLFSYYALLNAGILGIAWYKSWRILNLLGFVFTFVIATAWGFKYYQPQHFATTEPFLILFFVFYVAIAILFAHRQPPELKGYVDGSLVFGVPIVAFALQRPLVQNFEYGLAFSALAVAAFYILVATKLWQHSRPGMRLLTEAFLALGVVFATLAVPLSVDGRWTAAAWALEGAALIWIGIHQQRRLARAFGLLLQIGAGTAFFIAIRDPISTLPIWNGAYLGSLVIALGALFSALQMERHTTRLKLYEQQLTLPLLIWGLLWWLGAGLREIDIHLIHAQELHAALGLFMATAIAGEALSRRLDWPLLRQCLLAYPALLILATLSLLSPGWAAHPLHQWGWLAWPLALATHMLLLKRCASSWPAFMLNAWHRVGLWLLIGLLTWEFGWRMEHWFSESRSWSQLAWVIVAAAAIGLLTKFGARIRWPVADFVSAYQITGLFPVALYMLAWLLLISSQSGAAHPLPFIPILNPLSLGQLLVLVVLLQWQQWLRAQTLVRVDPYHLHLLTLSLLGGAFVWLNAEIARSVHALAQVPHRADALFGSAVFQATVSITWTLTALLVMTLAARHVRRDAWIVGAVLLAAVVGKLFLIDLAGIGTVTRIVSFLAVGGLMLVIGYLAPIPPNTPPPNTSEEARA